MKDVAACIRFLCPYVSLATSRVEAPVTAGGGEPTLSAAPAHASLTLCFLREVEEGLLAALEWMPYGSDVPTESQPALAAATEKHRRALDDVREVRQSVEWDVLNEELW